MLFDEFGQPTSTRKVSPQEWSAFYKLSRGKDAAPTGYRATGYPR
ncbi:MAG: hypothetical protein U5L72_08395 [Bacteroidales bacterium]|nr:hypothetical protein [Bacteroidales bacterium]